MLNTINKYFENILGNVTDKIYLKYFNLTSIKFENLIKASSQCSKVIFSNWMLKFDDKLKFEDKEYKIELLGIPEWEEISWNYGGMNSENTNSNPSIIVSN